MVRSVPNADLPVSFNLPVDIHQLTVSSYVRRTRLKWHANCDTNNHEEKRIKLFTLNGGTDK